VRGKEESVWVESEKRKEKRRRKAVPFYDVRERNEALHEPPRGCALFFSSFVGHCPAHIKRTNGNKQQAIIVFVQGS
jgi:hypothetical protein